MIGSAVAVLVLVAVFAVAGPVIARRADPAVATRMLVPASLLVAAASTFTLAMAAFTLIGQFPEVAELGPWSPGKLRAATPIPAAAAIAGGALLVHATVSTLILISRRSVALVGVHRACGRLGDPGSVVIVESDTPDAFTTPGVTGRIVVTRGMLAALTPPDLRAMLAHEESHLRHRHTWWLLAADLAAAVNPTLRATARSLRHTVERWADEDAADVTADRRTVAHAIASAALAAHEYRDRVAVLRSALGGDVPARVHAMLTPRITARPSVFAVAVAVALMVATVDATLGVGHGGEELLEVALLHRPAAVATAVAHTPR